MKWIDAGRIVTKKGREMILQDSQTEDAESHNIKSSAVYMATQMAKFEKWYQVCTQAVRDKKRELEWTDEGRITTKEGEKQEEWSLIAKTTLDLRYVKVLM